MRSSGGNYDSDKPANQFGRQRRQPFELIFTPRVFDRDVHLVNEADILQAAVKPGNLIGERIGGRSGVGKKPIVAMAAFSVRSANGHAAAPVARRIKCRRLTQRLFIEESTLLNLCFTYRLEHRTHRLSTR